MKEEAKRRRRRIRKREKEGWGGDNFVEAVSYDAIFSVPTVSIKFSGPCVARGGAGSAAAAAGLARARRVRLGYPTSNNGARHKYFATQRRAWTVIF